MDARKIRARKIAVSHYNKYAMTDKPCRVGLQDVRVIQFTEIVPNWKALIFSHLDTSNFLEVCYHGDTKKFIVNTYTHSSTHFMHLANGKIYDD